MSQPGTQVPGCDQVKPGLRALRSAEQRPIAGRGEKSKKGPLRPGEGLLAFAGEFPSRLLVQTRRSWTT